MDGRYQFQRYSREKMFAYFCKRPGTFTSRSDYQRDIQQAGITASTLALLTELKTLITVYKAEFEVVYQQYVAKYEFDPLDIIKAHLRLFAQPIARKIVAAEKKQEAAYETHKALSDYLEPIEVTMPVDAQSQPVQVLFSTASSKPKRVPSSEQLQEVNLQEPTSYGSMLPMFRA